MKTILSMSPDARTELSATLRLRWPDAEVRVADSADEVVREASWADIVFIDLRDDTIDFVRRLRATGNCGIILLSDHRTDEELMEVLDAGADDYLGASSSPTHFVARIAALLRRVRGDSGDSSLVRCGPLDVYPRSHQARLAGHELQLTPTEFSLIFHLASAKGETITVRALQKLVWESDTPIYLDSLRKCVQRLRKKLSQVPNSQFDVVVVRGIGYRLGHPIAKSSRQTRLSRAG